MACGKTVVIIPMPRKRGRPIAVEEGNAMAFRLLLLSPPLAGSLTQRSPEMSNHVRLVTKPGFGRDLAQATPSRPDGHQPLGVA